MSLPETSVEANNNPITNSEAPILPTFSNNNMIDSNRTNQRELNEDLNKLD